MTGKMLTLSSTALNAQQGGQGKGQGQGWGRPWQVGSSVRLYDFTVDATAGLVPPRFTSSFNNENQRASMLLTQGGFVLAAPPPQQPSAKLGLLQHLSKAKGSSEGERS